MQGLRAAAGGAGSRGPARAELGARGGAGAGLGGRFVLAPRWVNPRQVAAAAAAAAAAGFGGRPSASFLPALSSLARLVTM